MNDEQFEKLLKDVGAMYGNMGPGPGCPPDDMLLDYVYDELSETERKEIEKHKEHCERCYFEILKLEADRAGWENALEEDPDAAIAHALGTYGVEHMREAMRSSAATAQSVTTPSAPLWKAYRANIEAGWDRFQAALASLSIEELLFEGLSPVLVTRGGDRGDDREGEKETIFKSVHVLGDQPPVYPVFVSRDVQYQTLLTLRHQRKNMVVHIGGSPPTPLISETQGESHFLSGRGGRRTSAKL